MRASHADVYPEQLQDAREPGYHVQDRTPHHGCYPVFVSDTIVEFGYVPFQVSIPSCLSNESAQGALDCSVRSVSGSSIMQQKEWNGCDARDGSHMRPSLSYFNAHTERGPASGAAPRRNAVAILHCAFCATSLGDLCTAVQLVFHTH